MKIHFYKFPLLALIILFCSFSVKTGLLADDFRKGYYLDGNEKVEGYINFNYRDFYKFRFKKDQDSKVQTKNFNTCQGFFVDNKKFVVLGTLELKLGGQDFHTKKAFAEVIIEGPLNLYKVYSQMGDGNRQFPGVIEIYNLILEKGNSKSYVVLKTNSKKFKKEVSELVKERTDIAEKVNNDTYTFESIEELVRDFNNTK